MTPDQVRGMLYGLAVGDALGVPYEFKGPPDSHCHPTAVHYSHNSRGPPRTTAPTVTTPPPHHSHPACLQVPPLNICSKQTRAILLMLLRSPSRQFSTSIPHHIFPTVFPFLPTWTCIFIKSY